jgi:hypothetical protein
MKEPAGLKSSVGNTECLCREVRDLLAKVWSTLDRVRDISAPESTSSTMAGILEALVVKEDRLGAGSYLSVRAIISLFIECPA